MSLRLVLAVCLIAAAMPSGAGAQAQNGDAPKAFGEPLPVEEILSFDEALDVAAKASPQGVPSEIELHLEALPPQYEVTRLTADGTHGVHVHAVTGEVLETSYARIEPARGGYAPDVRRMLQRSKLDLRDATALAVARYDRTFVREVAFQTLEGELVVGVAREVGGERLGAVLDAETGEVLVEEL